MNSQPATPIFRPAIVWLFAAAGLLLCAAGQAQTTYQSVVLADNPLAFYALNPGTDGTSTAPDLTTNGNDGQAGGIATGIGPSEFITNAAYFDGSASIDLSQGTNASLLNYTGPITLEAWAQPANTSFFGDIVAKGYENDGQYYPEITLRVNGPTFTGGSEGDAGSTYATGGVETTNWSYVVVSMDGTNCSLYQNGVLVAQQPDTNGSYVFPEDWVIGAGSGAGTSRVFNGNISEVAIYNYGLTAAQVLTHFYIGMINSYPSNSVPIIISQPQSQSVYVGGSVTFSVQSVSEFPVTNQWYRAGAALSGQTNTTLKVLNVNAPEATNYTVVVGNINGTTTSSPAVLSLLVPGASLEWGTNNNDGTWDTGITTNWINLSSGTPSVFSANDSVLFTDNPAEPTSVTIDTNVSPSLITVDSSTNAFTFSGSGAITGSGSLTKEGSSLLTITTAGNFTGAVNIDGGVIYAGNNCFDSVSTISITNGATLDLAGGSIPNDTPVTVSGFGFGGEGAIYNSYADYPGESLNVTLVGDTLFGGTARWDFASGSQISGPYNLTLDFSANSVNSYYSQWNTVSVASDVLGVFVTNAIDPSAHTALGMSYDSTICQNPATVFTIAPTCQLVFYNGGFNGSIHALSGSVVYLWSAPAAFNGSTVTLEDNAGWESWGSSSSTEPVNSAVVLNGVALMVVGNHYMQYTNVISGPGGFIMYYYDHGLMLSASNTYSGPTIISGGLELFLTNNGSISDSSLIFFGGTNSAAMDMDATGRNDQTLTLAGGQTLEGVGSLNGSLDVSFGATIAPGGTNTTLGITTGSSPTGTLSATANIALNGTTLIKLDGSSNDVIDAGQTITYGGTLDLENISGTALAAGNNFKVFGAAGYASSFGSVTPATPGAGLAWDLSGLGSGQIGVVTASSSPTIASAIISGGNLLLSGTGGTANGTYYVFATTNLSPANWLAVATNAYDGSGNFSVSTPVLTGAPSQFYRLQQQQ
jgi:autotransporter-associated beta strand protein